MEKVFVIAADNSRIQERWAEVATEGGLPLGGWFPDDLELEISTLLLADKVRVYVFDDILTESMKTRLAVAKALGKAVTYTYRDAE
jgi:hypothetical protein